MFSSLFITFALQSLVVLGGPNSILKALDDQKYSIADLQSAFRSGGLNSSRLVSYYLDRIKKYDKAGPTFNSIIELAPTLQAQAKAADEKIKQCRQSPVSARCFNKLGSLIGIPILVKDNINTKDMTTAAGSLALVGAQVPGDAPIIAHLRKEGAIIMGKAGMTEWANWRISSNSPNGWSGRGGQVRNVYNATWDALGSSSGCAVAVSANLATACIGTETFGSIVQPSIANGIIGIKPTIKLVSQKGIVPITSNLDTAGPMCRATFDCDLILGIIASKSSFPQPKFRRLKIGYFKDSLNLLSPEVSKHFDDLLAVVGSNSASLVDMSQYLNLQDYSDDPGPDVTAFLNCRFRDDLKSYLGTLTNTTMRTLDDIMKFNYEHPIAERMPEFGQGVFELASTAPTYQKNQTFCRQLKKEWIAFGRTDSRWGMDTLLKKARVDLIIEPAEGSAGFSLFFSGFALYPIITVPIGINPGAGAWAVTAVAKGGNEGALFAFSEFVMNAFYSRVKPKEAP